MNIKIIGSNCSNGIKLKKIVNRVNETYDNSIQIECLDLKEDYQKYNIKDKPGLIINGTLISQGKVISDREIIKYLKFCES